jgi:hypothetical protein
MQQQPKTSEVEVMHPPTTQVSALPRRALLGVLGLLVLTLVSLGLAWFLPDATLLHYLWVAQAVPVLYWLLTWWATQSSPASEDAP